MHAVRTRAWIFCSVPIFQTSVAFFDFDEPAISAPAHCVQPIVESETPMSPGSSFAKCSRMTMTSWLVVVQRSSSGLFFVVSSRTPSLIDGVLGVNGRRPVPWSWTKPVSDRIVSLRHEHWDTHGGDDTDTDTVQAAANNFPSLRLLSRSCSTCSGGHSGWVLMARRGRGQISGGRVEVVNFMERRRASLGDEQTCRCDCGTWTLSAAFFGQLCWETR